MTGRQYYFAYWREILSLNVNGASFFALAKIIPFRVIRKLQQDEKALEALLLGQAGLLSAEMSSVYGANLWKSINT